MSLLADKIKSKYKSWTSTSKPGPQNRDIGRKLRVTGTCLGFLVLVLGFATIYNIYGSEEASAGSISVSVSGDINLGLVTNDETGTAGESSAATVSVTSTDAGGYTLMLAGGNSEGKLVGTDSSNYFTSITDTVKESTFASSSDYNNKWGLLPSVYNGIANDTNDPYLYRVPTGNNLANIDTTHSPNSSPNEYTLAVSARANNNTAIDTYSNSFVVSATGNATDYTINYTDPLDFPEMQIGSTDSNSVTLSTVVPKRNGYKFAGWCSEVPSGFTCSGITYQPGDSYSLGSGSRANLYAMWTEITCNGTMIQSDTSRYYCFTNTTATWTARSASSCGDTSIWKIPTMAEIYTLFNYASSNGSGGNKLYKTLELSGGHNYWSDTENPNNANEAFLINVGSSSSSRSAGSKTSSQYIMCVQ